MLRKKIDFLDDELLDIIEKRMCLVNEVGKYKQNKRIPIFQKNRWEELLLNRIRTGTKKGLEEKFIKNIFESIHKESVYEQEKKTVSKRKKVCSNFTKKH